jgi:glycerophosphoryl diester phosphodiesterase
MHLHRPLTVASWKAAQSGPIYTAHRGSGDVYPEHTMEAYQAAFDAGATCMEVSVVITADGELICMHDPIYDRTTTGSGKVGDQPSSVLESIRIWQPHLGAAWTRNPPRVPLVRDVLQRFGGLVILCVEAKVRRAYEPLMAMIEAFGLRDSVIVKMSNRSLRLHEAQAAGYPVFRYLGSAHEVTRKNIKKLGKELRPELDYLVMAVSQSPARPSESDDLVRRAVATGVPTWVFPLHRRSQAEHYFNLGVQAAICSSYPYIAGVIAPVPRDSWSTLAIAPGEVSKSAALEQYGPSFTDGGQLVLAAEGFQHFMLLGQFCPIPAAAGSYAIDVDVGWLVTPAAGTDGVTIAFGHEDDEYYEDGLGAGTGYRLTLRAGGELSLYRHRKGMPAGVLLAEVATPVLAAGDTAHLRIEVSPDRIFATRTDVGASISTNDAAVRGGYVHVGRSATAGSAAFANFVIS